MREVISEGGERDSFTFKKRLITMVIWIMLMMCVEVRSNTENTLQRMVPWSHSL